MHAASDFLGSPNRSLGAQIQEIISHPDPLWKKIEKEEYPNYDPKFLPTNYTDEDRFKNQLQGGIK